MHSGYEFAVIFAQPIVAPIDEDILVKPLGALYLKLHQPVIIKQLLRNRGHPHEGFRDITKKNELRSALVNEDPALHEFRQLGFANINRRNRRNIRVGMTDLDVIREIVKTDAVLMRQRIVL